MTQTRVPEAKPRPQRRLASLLTYGLGVGSTLANAQVQWELVPVWGSSTLTVRFKGTAAGALDIVPVGPDFNVDQSPATPFSALAGTVYGTGGPAQVPVTANAEAISTYSVKGESYVLIKFTGSGAGVVTYCDVSQQPIAGR